MNFISQKVSREQIRYAYLFLLGREPESEEAYAAHSNFTDLYRLRSAILASVEYRMGLKSVLATLNKVAVVFIHLEKTGGTTMHNVLAANFSEDRVSPAHYSFLESYSTTENGYDFFSGHFDYEMVSSIPRSSLKLISIFRKPSDRLISQYRFWQSHPLSPNLDTTHRHVLAKKLGPEEFFAHPAIRFLPHTNNYYLRVFAGSVTNLVRPSLSPDEERSALDLAKSRIRSLQGIGITERMKESVDVICRALGFAVPAAFETVHRTDDLPSQEPSFAKVPPVKMTDSLQEVLNDLIRYDDLLHATATEEFERRVTLRAEPGSE
jgi:hypothetical protein